MTRNEHAQAHTSRMSRGSAYPAPITGPCRSRKRNSWRQDARRHRARRLQIHTRAMCDRVPIHAFLQQHCGRARARHRHFWVHLSTERHGIALVVGGKVTHGPRLTTALMRGAGIGGPSGTLANTGTASGPLASQKAAAAWQRCSTPRCMHYLQTPTFDLYPTSAATADTSRKGL